MAGGDVALFFDTVFLQEVLEISFLPQNFLWSMYLKSTNTSDQEFVMLDVFKEPRKVATYTSAKSKGTIVTPKEFTSRVYQTPYIKEAMITDALRLLKRQIGQSPFAPNKSPKARALERLGRDTVMLKNRVFRLIEKTIANMFFTGKVVAVGEGINVEADFGLPADNIFTVANGKISADWSNASAKIIDDVEDAADVVQKNTGCATVQCIMGFNLYKHFRANEEIKSLLDNRRVESGELKINLLPKGVRYIGSIGQIDYYVYVEYVEEDNGDLTNIFPADKAIVTSDELRAGMEYGAIQDLEYGDFEGEMFMKSWIEPNPSQQVLLLQSSPLPVHHQMEGVVVLEPITVP